MCFIILVNCRSLPESQRTFGLGLQWVFIRCLGTVPGPILFGYVFDSGCLQWQDSCSEQGSCWIYNGEAMSHKIVILAVALNIGIIIFYSLALYCYHPLPLEGSPTKTNTTEIFDSMATLPEDSIQVQDHNTTEKAAAIIVTVGLCKESETTRL